MTDNINKIPDNENLDLEQLDGVSGGMYVKENADGSVTIYGDHYDNPGTIDPEALQNLADILKKKVDERNEQNKNHIGG